LPRSLFARTFKGCLSNVNIHNITEKLAKSRDYLLRLFRGARIDLILVAASVAVLVLIVSSQFIRKVIQPRRIDISVSQGGENLFGADTLAALVREFEEHNPALRIRIAADNSADILFFDDGEIGSLLAGSALASLKPYVHSETQAEQWAIPLVSFMDVFLYNIDILQEAGSDRPPKTRADFLAAAGAVSAQGAAQPLALGLSREDPLALRRDLYPWIWAAGGDLRQGGGDNGETITLSKTATDIIAFFGQLSSEGFLAPGSLETTRAQRLAEFAGGSIAMMAASSRDIPLLQRSAPGLNFGVTAMPQTAQGKNRLGLSGIYAGISSACALSDEAWAFLAFVAGRKQVLEEALSAVPGSHPSAFPGAYITADPLYSKAWDIFEAADIVEYHPADPLEEETSRVIREKLEEALE